MRPAASSVLAGLPLVETQSFWIPKSWMHIVQPLNALVCHTSETPAWRDWLNDFQQILILSDRARSRSRWKVCSKKFAVESKPNKPKNKLKNSRVSNAARIVCDTPHCSRSIDFTCEPSVHIGSERPGEALWNPRHAVGSHGVVPNSSKFNLSRLTGFELTFH